MSSDTEIISDQENNENRFKIEEESTYPLNNNIMYQECVNNVTIRSFNYVIIKEGVYPNEAAVTKKAPAKGRQTQQFKIPHNYIVETTWGRAAKRRTVHCKIEYINTEPNFQIKYGPNFQHNVSSMLSASNAALKYEQVTKYLLL
jgi:hypothetical protein